MAITEVVQRSDVVTVGCACTGGTSSLRCKWPWQQPYITVLMLDPCAGEWGRDMNLAATIRDSVEHQLEAFRHVDLYIPEQDVKVRMISSSSRRSRRVLTVPQTAE